jgi:SET domain-containing protein
MKKTTSKYIELRNSKIHGIGIFARRNIPKGTKIIEYVGRLISKKESEELAEKQLEFSLSNKQKGAVYIFELNKKFDIDGNVFWNTARFINHSCSPNCETEDDDRHIWILALRDIKKGEELSYNYGYDLEDYKEHICKCGSKNCLGYIIGDKFRKKFLKLKK